MGQPSFDSNNVHLWSTSLDVPDQIYDALIQHLSLEERKRAAQFTFPQDHRNFITSRGVLKDILSRYLQCQPADILIQYGTEGKPNLYHRETSNRLEFNLSHSSGFLVVAVSQGQRVGVDIELVRPMADIDLIALQAFSEYEREVLRGLTGEEKQSGFFRCWTRKETYLKALGHGLSIPLDSFDMSLAPNNPIGMLANRLNPDEASNWSFYTFIPTQGFLGAVAVEGQEVVPVFIHWKAAEE